MNEFTLLILEVKLALKELGLDFEQDTNFSSVFRFQYEGKGCAFHLYEYEAVLSVEAGKFTEIGPAFVIYVSKEDFTDRGIWQLNVENALLEALNRTYGEKIGVSFTCNSIHVIRNLVYPLDVLKHLGNALNLAIKTIKDMEETARKHCIGLEQTQVARR
jgi:hypothetical protein